MWILDAWLAIYNTVNVLMRDNKMDGLPQVLTLNKVPNMWKHSPKSTDFPSHEDGIPGLVLMSCDSVQTAYPLWASVSSPVAPARGPPPKLRPPHTLLLPNASGSDLLGEPCPPPRASSHHASAVPAAHSACSLFLNSQPTWHPSSFRSQFKHHFLREASLQKQPGPMLPLKTI